MVEPGLLPLWVSIQSSGFRELWGVECVIVAVSSVVWVSDIALLGGQNKHLGFKSVWRCD